MEIESIVLMLKNNESGFLEKELAIIPIGQNIGLIAAAYVSEDENGLNVHMKLTCDADVSGEDFDRIYDAYGDGWDFDEIDQVIEEDDCYNPTWEMIYKYDDNCSALIEKTVRIIELHKSELDRIITEL